MNILDIIITGAITIFSVSCIIGTISCVAHLLAAAEKDELHDEVNCKIVAFLPREDSPIVEDPTYATDYETGKLVLIQDDVYSSDESDDYDGALLSNPYKSPNTPKFQNKGQQTVESDSENEREYFLM